MNIYSILLAFSLFQWLCNVKASQSVYITDNTIVDYKQLIFTIPHVGKLAFFVKIHKIESYKTLAIYWYGAYIKSPKFFVYLNDFTDRAIDSLSKRFFEQATISRQFLNCFCNDYLFEAFSNQSISCAQFGAILNQYSKDLAILARIIAKFSPCGFYYNIAALELNKTEMIFDQSFCEHLVKLSEFSMNEFIEYGFQCDRRKQHASLLNIDVRSLTKFCSKCFWISSDLESSSQKNQDEFLN
ncbi:hypothetical protein FACS1894113_0210 [Alphaproteobacteria bacterium]|nr:hypothetical protein FACS1894113_0210 [Alphaproteobacteria bacterium]